MKRLIVRDMFDGVVISMPIDFDTGQIRITFPAPRNVILEAIEIIDEKQEVSSDQEKVSAELPPAGANSRSELCPGYKTVSRNAKSIKIAPTSTKGLSRKLGAGQNNGPGLPRSVDKITRSEEARS